MPLTASGNANQLGALYQFGFPGDSTAPDFGGNFIARSAELRYEAEIFAQAQDGDGHTDSIVTSTAEMRKITGTFTGYIITGFSVDAFPPTFSFVDRLFIVRNVSVPHRKGEFSEVTCEAESYGLITTP
jgi:hypothetical protein